MMDGKVSLSVNKYRRELMGRYASSSVRQDGHGSR
jgi:hypothetical protein